MPSQTFEENKELLNSKKIEEERKEMHGNLESLKN